MVKKKQTEGVIRVNPRGFGFVERKGGDVFIPRGELHGAVDGDKVLALITGTSSRGPEGRVKDVLERKHTHLAGTVRKRGQHGIWLFAPLLGAKSPVIVEGGDLERGDRVFVKVDSWGDEDIPTKCTFEKKIGSIDDASIDVEAACAEFSLSMEYPVEPKGLKMDTKDREDLRDLWTVTIDPKTAKDFDDALSLTKDQKGHFHLHVHIADVTHFVQPGSEIDEEAKKRCNSTYFPGVCIPMLPPALADDLCSLKPNVDRLAVSVEMKFNEEGELLQHRIFRSVIRSQKRYSYEEAFEKLDELELMVELCGHLKRHRKERGSVELALPEAVLQVDEKGNPTGVEYVEYDITHQMVEEFMLKANEVVAKHLTDKSWPLTYRVHEAPSGDDLRTFGQLVRALGEPMPPDPTIEDLQALFDRVAHKPEGHLLAVAYIRSMKMAIYSAENVGHYGLSLEHYCHFTSPIRRYPDLVVHRILFGHGPSEEEIARIASVCSDQERHSARAENSVKRLKRLRYLAERRGTEFEAVITEAKPFGITFVIKDLLFEGFIHVSQIGNDYYEFDERKMALRGRDSGDTFSVGSVVEVLLNDVDLIERDASWSLL